MNILLWANLLNFVLYQNKPNLNSIKNKILKEHILNLFQLFFMNETLNFSQIYILKGDHLTSTHPSYSCKSCGS